MRRASSSCSAASRNTRRLAVLVGDREATRRYKQKSQSVEVQAKASVCELKMNDGRLDKFAPSPANAYSSGLCDGKLRLGQSEPNRIAVRRKSCQGSSPCDPRMATTLGGAAIYTCYIGYVGYVCLRWSFAYWLPQAAAAARLVRVQTHLLSSSC